MASPDPPNFDLSQLGFDVSKMRPKPGFNPFAGTREEAIADSTDRISEFQKAYPNVDVKTAIVEPTVNFYYDMKEKLDPETYNKHQDLMKEMMNYLMPPGHSYPLTSPSPSAAEATAETEPTGTTEATNPSPENDDATKSDVQTNNEKNTKEEQSNSEKLALAQATFWKARGLLKGNEEVLKLFDSVYLRPERPVEVMLEQLQKCFSHMPQVYAALAAGGSEKVNDNSEDTEGADTKAVVDEDAPALVAADEGN